MDGVIVIGEITYNNCSDTVRSIRTICSNYRFAFMGCISGIACILGSIGNMASMFVFTRSKKVIAKATCLFLNSLAAADLCYLITYFLSVVWINFFIYVLPSQVAAIHKVMPYFSMYLFPLSSAALAASKYYTVLVTTHRYMAVCKPFKVRVITQMRVAIPAVVAIAFTSIALMIPKYFEVEIKYYEFRNETYPVLWQTPLWQDPAYQLGYKKIFGVLFLSVIPLVSVTIMTGLIIQGIIMAKRAKANYVTPSASSSTQNVGNNTLDAPHHPGTHRWTLRHGLDGQHHPTLDQHLQTRGHHHQTQQLQQSALVQGDSLTKPLVIIAVLFIGCHILSVFYPLCYLIKGLCTQNIKLDCPCPCYYLAIASDTFTVLNSAVNFLIYYPTTNFRRQVHRICMCQKRRVNPISTVMEHPY